MQPTSLSLAIVAFTMLTLGSRTVFAAPPCSQTKINEVIAPANRWDSVKIDCDLTLNSSHTVTKFMHFEGSAASNTTLNCNGATINGGPGSPNDNLLTSQQIVQVRSALVMNGVECARDSQGFCRWSRPENVTIKGCNIYGRVAVRGWSMESPGPEEGGESSTTADHVARARSIAPRNVTLDQVHIANMSTEEASAPLYIYPGSAKVTLSNSVISGRHRVAIYLDAETEGNVIKNNSFLVTSSRELIAIDGSENNLIIGNAFKDPALNGGIFLYRNCGEGGGVRHTTPSNNAIINNAFHYPGSSGSPFIWVGSRNATGPYTSWCPDDFGYPFGSSISDLDHAQNNAIMDNRFVNRTVESAIRIGRPDTTDSNNLLASNTTESTTPATRPSGCYLPTGFRRSYIWHGGAVSVIQDPGASCITKRCTDGVLTDESSCAAQAVEFECQAVSNSAGCTQRVYCPNGTSAVGVTAACDLENSWVSPSELATVPSSRVRVMTESDSPYTAQCYAANSGVSTGDTTVRGGTSMGSIWIGCSEQESNGGDCHIRGKLHCQ